MRININHTHFTKPISRSKIIVYSWSPTKLSLPVLIIIECEVRVTSESKSPLNSSKLKVTFKIALTHAPIRYASSLSMLRIISQGPADPIQSDPKNLY